MSVPQPEPVTFAFTLPEGYRAPDGTVHREGAMRMATAYDEVAPLRDPRVQRNTGYLVIILLARVITRLGTMEQVDPKIIEGMYARDLAYLQDLYQRINRTGSANLHTKGRHY